MDSRKLCITAAAVALTSPAFAQSTGGNVTLYGRLNGGVDNASATGSYFNGTTVGGFGPDHDFKSRTRIFDAVSRLGVRGNEDLGNGLRAVFQIESGLNTNNGQSVAEANQYNPSAGTLASRSTWVGLTSNWGQVLFGRQDVFWGNGTIVQTGANYVNTEIPWIEGIGGRVTTGVTRQSNVVSYLTPTVAGFNATFYYSPDANASGNLIGSSQESAGPGKNTNARLWAATARWAGGPLQVQYDFVNKQNATDFASLSVAGSPSQNLQAKVWAHKLGVAWMYQPGGQISLIGTHVINAGVTGFDLTGAQTLKQDTLSVSWEHLISNNVLLLAQAGHMFNARGCDGTAVQGLGAGISNPTNYTQACLNSSANAYLAGVRYNFSKRTGAYLTWNAIQNGQNQFVDYGPNSLQVGATPTSGSTLPGTLQNPGSGGIGVQGKGARVQVLAIGLQHNF